MEDIKQLTIESVTIFKTGTSASGAWTLYNVIANGEKYSTFLDLTPGKTATFKVKTEPSTKLDRNGKPYMNRTIVGYTGSIDQMPQKPYRTSAEATGTPAALTPSATDKTLEARLVYVEQGHVEFANTLLGLFTRIERLEGFMATTKGIDLAEDPDQTIPY